MKKQILNVGKALNRAEQKEIHGGKMVVCYDYAICPPIHEMACLIIGGVCEYFEGEDC